MNTEARFAGTMALVTGGASGIGRAVAERIAREGADVAILDKNGDAAQTVAAGIGKSGRRAVALAVDITDPDATAAAVS